MIRNYVPNRRPSTTSGFSLIEVLVAVAIIAIAVGLTLAAVQKVRGAAARTQCADRFRQVALGLHSYHDARGALPAGLSYQDGRSTTPHLGWPAAVLPYLEQAT